MLIRVGFEITIDAQPGTTLILALLPHSSSDARIIGSNWLQAEPEVAFEEFLDPFGNRRVRLQTPPGALTLWYDCIVEDDGAPDIFDWSATQLEVSDLPPDTLPFLTASRYCESDLLANRAMALFGGTTPGWGRVQAICNFVHNHLTFGYGFGRSDKTAADAMREKTGVCRDFAHLAVTLCRAMNIPARYASGYLGDIGVPYSGPGDFCAWFEVYLAGRWYTFDARYNTPRIGRVLMIRGRDAADGAMITSFGRHHLSLFRVWTDEVTGTWSDNGLLRLLQDRPSAPALTLAPVDNASADTG